MNQLNLRIRTSRRRAGFSQAALATVLGVNRSSVAQWEQTRGSAPTSKHLGEIAVAVGVRYEWLATGRGRMLPGSDDSDGSGVDGVQLNYYAHDEVEERVLLALRKIDYWQTVVVAELAESLAHGRMNADAVGRVRVRA